MRVRVLSRQEVEAGGAEGADAVISIRGTDEATGRDLKIALQQATQGESARLLRLCFDDIGVPAFGPFVGPTMQQITETIAFGRRVKGGSAFFDGPNPEPPLIAIHCEHGVSRSAAIALALLADDRGDGEEHEAVNTLLREDIDGKFQPNPLIISLADACLFRYGRIDVALSELAPRYIAVRKHWRQIAAAPDGAIWKPHRSRRFNGM